jgi:glycosidase
MIQSHASTIFLNSHNPLILPPPDFFRIPPKYNQLVLMVSMMLPGTLIFYYGDEIGFDSEKIREEENIREFDKFPI